MATLSLQPTGFLGSGHCRTIQCRTLSRRLRPGKRMYVCVQMRFRTLRNHAFRYPRSYVLRVTRRYALHGMACTIWLNRPSRWERRLGEAGGRASWLS